MSDVIIPYRFVCKRDTAANFTSANTVLKAGEWGVETDTLKTKMGDGSTAWNSLAYQGIWTLTDLRRALDLIGSSAAGDIIYKGASGWTRLPKGTNGQVLTLSSGSPSWAASGGGSSFTPLDLFDGSVTNGAWYDAGDLATLWQDTAGTTPVTTAGQSVARMDDKSGLGNNATQATSGSRPTYQVDGDGFGYLSFDGNDYLNCGTAFNAEAFMACVVYYTTTSNCRLLDARGTGMAGAAKGWAMKGSNPSADLIVVDDGSAAVSFNDTPTGITTGFQHVICARYRYGRLQYNLDAAYPTSQKTVISALGTITGAQPSRIGTASNSAGTQSLTGRIYQVAVINRHATFAEQKKLIDYCIGKAGF